MGQFRIARFSSFLGPIGRKLGQRAILYARADPEKTRSPPESGACYLPAARRGRGAGFAEMMRKTDHHSTVF